ncbi:hypothetical protein CCACVL1_25201 [Corchorus capsularis]|uniref:Uncharacterized protein n=1 Tax=Corchorus capsularis TaxID=210143 RepID=A0A1R3GLJ8_COCAP|nr:hypothetical protein CCACVL1_25201 [Corchorus capsularis]
MFDAIIDGPGIPQLRNAIGIISTVGNPAMVMMTAAGLSIQASDELGLAAELRLNRAACVSCRFQPAVPENNYECIFINLTPLRQFLEEEATEEDRLLIVHNPLPIVDDQREWLMVFLLNPAAANGRHVLLEAINDQLQVPSMMVDDTRYMVTGMTPSLRMRNIVQGLRYFFDGNGHRIDNLRPIGITLTALMIRIRLNLAQSRGNFCMIGAKLPLAFDLPNLEAFINATRMSENVLIHADPYRSPLLNCPFGNGLGNLFFFGNIIHSSIWWLSFYDFIIIN